MTQRTYKGNPVPAWVKYVVPAHDFFGKGVRVES